jgi:hypothetical protein
MKILKMLLFSSCLLTSAVVLTYSFWPFGDLKVSNEIKKMQGSVDKNMSDIKLGVQDNQTGINNVSGKVDTLSHNVVTLSSKVDATATASVPITASAGYTQGNSQTSFGSNGKQITKTVTTNDSSVVKAMLSSSATFNLALLAFIRMISMQRAKVENRLMDMMRERDDDYNRLVDRNNDNYDKLIASKEFYKAQYMSSLKTGVAKDSADSLNKA